MKLYDRQNRARERALTLTSLRGRGNPGTPATATDGDRLLIRFTYPNDIRGTGFLVLEHPKGEDERFLYLPSLGRVRRIAGVDVGKIAGNLRRAVSGGSALPVEILKEDNYFFKLSAFQEPLAQRNRSLHANLGLFVTKCLRERGKSGEHQQVAHLPPTLARLELPNTASGSLRPAPARRPPKRYDRLGPR